MQIVFTIPSGRTVTAGAYVAAWRSLQSAPANQSVKGWEYFPVPVASVLRDMRRMVDDVITRHDRTARQCSDNRLQKKIRSALERGAIVYTCRNCDRVLNWKTVNPNNQNSRYCDASCQP